MKLEIIGKVVEIGESNSAGMAYVAVEFPDMDRAKPGVATDRIVIYCDPNDAPRFGAKIKLTIEET